MSLGQASTQGAITPTSSMSIQRPEHRTRSRSTTFAGPFCTKLILAHESDEKVADVMGWSPRQVRGIRRSYVDQRHVSVAIGERLRGSL